MALMEYCVVNVCLGDFEFIKNTRNGFDYSYSNTQDDLTDRVRLLIWSSMFLLYDLLSSSKLDFFITYYFIAIHTWLIIFILKFVDMNWICERLTAGFSATGNHNDSGWWPCSTVTSTAGTGQSASDRSLLPTLLSAIVLHHQFHLLAPRTLYG